MTEISEFIKSLICLFPDFQVLNCDDYMTRTNALKVDGFFRQLFCPFLYLNIILYIMKVVVYV